MAFSQNLKYLRKKNGITAEQFALELGVTLKDVSGWESGGDLPGEELLEAMSGMFDVTPDELVHGDVAKGDGEAGAGGKAGRRKKMGLIADAVLLALSVAVYVGIGVACGLWHPAWVIFIFALSASSFFHAVTNANGLRGLQTSGELGCGIMLLAVAVYLVLGFIARLWHPGWIIFIAAIVLDGIIGYLLNKK